MQKTAEMIESVIKHVEELLKSGDISHEIQSICLNLRDHLRADQAAAKRAASLQVESKKQ